MSQGMAVVMEKVNEWEKSVGINRFFAVDDVKNTRRKKESEIQNLSE